MRGGRSANKFTARYFRFFILEFYKRISDSVVLIDVTVESEARHHGQLYYPVNVLLYNFLSVYSRP